MIKRVMPFALTALALGLTPGSSQATIMFTTDPVTTTINVISFDETGDRTAVGEANANGDDILNVETDTNLVAPASGQARIAPADDSALFTTVILTPITGMGFSVIELNPQIFTPQGAEGTFTLTALDQFGNSFTSGVFDLSNGENRVAAVATDDQLITQLTLTASGAIVGDVRQIRLTSQEIPTTPVPEPSTVAMAITGLFPLGLVGLRRLRQRQAVSSA